MAADAGVLALNDPPETKTAGGSYESEYIAKKQFYDQRREYNRMLTHEARSEHLTGRMIEAAEAANRMLPLIRRHGKTADEADIHTEAVLVLTDWHYGMKTDNIWNRYDVHVCRERIEVLYGLAAMRLQDHCVERLHVLILGDMANGAIHTSSRVAAEEDVCDQLMQVSEMLAELISDLTDFVTETQVYCAYGNHMRTVQNAKDSIHSDNMEKIIPWWMKQRFAERDDIFIMETVSHELLRVPVCGYEVCGLHGDLDNSRTSTLILSRLYEKAFGRKMEYLFTGHFHSIEHDESLGIETIRSGSLCGTDEYAKNKRLFSNPTQTLAIFEPGYGLDALYNLRVDAGGE